MAATRRKKSAYKLPVIVRVEKKPRWPKDVKGLADLDDMIAVFPTECDSYEGPGYVSFYVRVGGHSNGRLSVISATTRPAVPREAAKMLHELRRIGYKNLKRVARAAVARSVERRRQWRENTGRHGGGRS